MHDVVVVGGGPAGLVVALGAARAGLDVIVCEKRPDVIDKACGEGLMPGALHALQALGVDPPGYAIRGITYRQDGYVAHGQFPHGPGRGVRRTTLHTALRDAVKAHGVAVLERPIAGIDQHDDWVEAGGLRARYLVAADGLHSPIRTAVGLAAPSGRASRSGSMRWGQRRHYAVATVDDHVEVSWAARSELYITPVAADTIGVAVLSSTRGGFEAQLAEFPALSRRLADATPVSAVRGAGPLRQRVSGRVAGRVLLVGDASGYIDALTGEGLAVSFAAAAELVKCLVAGRPETYERAWSRVSRRSRWITSALLWGRTQPLISTRIVPIAARFPRLFTAAVGQLAE